MTEELNLTCDICHNQKAVGVASSGLAPISFAICEFCLNANAEEEGIVLHILWSVGNDLSKLRPELPEGISLWKDGRYISLREYHEKYYEVIAANIADFDKSIEEYYRKKPLLHRIYLRLSYAVAICISTIRYGRNHDRL
jgi:hypothetical protein